MVGRFLCAAALVVATLPAQSVEPCEKALQRWDFAEATRLANELVQRSPKSAPAYVLLARAYMGRNEPQLALAALDHATKLAPDNLDALYYLTKLTGVLSQQQHLALLNLVPNSARAHQLKAEGHAARNEPAEAEREYKAALEQKPGAVSIQVALGDVKRLQGELEDALAWYLKASEAEPKFYDALYGAGACYYFLKQQENALEFFRRALAADPASIAAKLALGQTLLAVQQPAEAIPLLEAAVKADPNMKRLYYLLARAYTAVGRKDDAAKAFKRFHSIVEIYSDQDPLSLGTQP